MEVLEIILGLALILGLIILYVSAWGGINERSAAKYHYEPLNGWTTFLTVVTFSALWIGLGMVFETPQTKIPPLPWDGVFLHSETGNGLVLAAMGGVVGIVNFLWIWKKTSFLMAFGSAILLTIAGLAVVLLIVGIILLFMASVSGRNRGRSQWTAFQSGAVDRIN